MKNIKKIILTMTLALLAVAAPDIVNASVLNETHAVEVAAVSFRGLKICHQNEWRNLSINLEYNMDAEGNFTDVQDVKNHIKGFLEGYSNPMDFWEIMNTKLVLSLSEAFPTITTMKSTLALAPDQALRFPRESTVKYDRNVDVLKESFQFTKLNYLICQNSFHSLDLRVTWDVLDNPNPSTDYPDYQWVDEAMETFFNEHPVSITEWKILKPELQVYLLDKFPTLSSIDIDIKIAE